MPSLSSSIANLLLTRSPRHAWQAHPKLNPQWRAAEATSEMYAGSIAHQMLLEGHYESAVIVDADDWRTKAAKEQRDQAVAEGCYPILRRKFEPLREMVAAAYEQLNALRIDLTLGQDEETAVWQEGSAWCRARFDKRAGDLYDYKTTDNAEPNAFARRIAQMGYDVQAAFYQRGVHLLTGEIPRFLFIVQETEAPYLLSVIELEPAWLELAHIKVDHAIRTWQECMESGRWPGYPQHIATAVMPGWAVSQWEEVQASADIPVPLHINPPGWIAPEPRFDLGDQA
jgi:hypothetical protein